MGVDPAAEQGAHPGDAAARRRARDRRPEDRGIGADRVLFASDEPWSDFWSEYWKINGAPVSDELKQRILWRNYEELYGDPRR